MPNARDKNKARDRRKQKAREEASKKEQALRLIRYYSRLWVFWNATGYMNTFKYKIIDRILSKIVAASSVKCINSWYKGGGYIVFYVSGLCDGYPIQTSLVAKEFYHKLGHFILTQSGSLYRLGYHQDNNFDVAKDKRHDMYCFSITESEQLSN